MIKLELTLDETNKVLEALGNQPYVKVTDVINKIVSQAEGQMKPKEDPAEVVEAYELSQSAQSDEAE